MLESELGRGGMGIVYRGHDTLLERYVAVKVLNDRGLGTEGRSRLLREAQSAAQLNHPNNVSVYDAGVQDSSPFIVMKLAEGRTLHDERPKTIDETVTFVIQVCSALEHAHAQHYAPPGTADALIASDDHRPGNRRTRSTDRGD